MINGSEPLMDLSTMTGEGLPEFTLTMRVFASNFQLFKTSIELHGDKTMDPVLRNMCIYPLYYRYVTRIQYACCEILEAAAKSGRVEYPIRYSSAQERAENRKMNLEKYGVPYEPRTELYDASKVKDEDFHIQLTVVMNQRLEVQASITNGTKCPERVREVCTDGTSQVAIDTAVNRIKEYLCYYIFLAYMEHKDIKAETCV